MLLSLSTSVNVFACTGVVVGKDATEDGFVKTYTYPLGT